MKKEKHLFVEDDVMTQRDEIKELREDNKRLSNQLFKSIKEIQRLNNELEKVK